MSLTKTQINYLENKLDRAVQEKINAYRDKYGTQNISFEKFVFQNLKAGKVKMINKSDIIQVLDNQINGNNYYYQSTSISVENLITKEDNATLRAEYNKNEDKINDYCNRVRKAKTNALDKIVLEGVDVETALAEIDKIKE